MKLNYQPRLQLDATTGSGSPWLGAAIGGGSSLLGDIFNLFGQSKANREQEQYNINVMNQQRQWALQDVATQNAYNSPVQQMARLKEAGLNPNLVYGEGIQATGQSDQPRSVSAPSYTPDNTLSGFSNLGSQALAAYNTGFDVKSKTTSIENQQADTSNKLKYGVFQDIKNIEEKSNGRADPKMAQFYRDLDQNMQGYEEKIKGNQSRASEMIPLQASLDFNMIKDKNDREWAENTRRQALQAPTLALAVQSVANAVEQNAGIKQANQNAAAEFQNILESAHLKQLDAQIKTQELGGKQVKEMIQPIIDLLILSKAIK